MIDAALAGGFRQRLAGHRQLADGVFVTAYGNGQCVVVNYSQQGFLLPTGQAVPPRAHVLTER